MFCLSLSLSLSRTLPLYLSLPHSLSGSHKLLAIWYLRQLKTMTLHELLHNWQDFPQGQPDDKNMSTSQHDYFPPRRPICPQTHNVDMATTTTYVCPIADYYASNTTTSTTKTTQTAYGTVTTTTTIGKTTHDHVALTYYCGHHDFYNYTTLCRNEKASFHLCHVRQRPLYDDTRILTTFNPPTLKRVKVLQITCSILLSDILPINESQQNA